MSAEQRSTRIQGSATKISSPTTTTTMSAPASPSANVKDDSPPRLPPTKIQREMPMFRKKVAGKRRFASALDKGAARRRIREKMVKRKAAEEREKETPNADGGEDDEENEGDEEANRQKIREGKKRARSEVDDEDDDEGSSATKVSTLTTFRFSY